MAEEKEYPGDNPGDNIYTGPDIPYQDDADARLTSNNVTYNAPASVSSAVYPFNNVKRTIGGHLFEENNSLGFERIKRTHCTGTSEDLGPDGSRTSIITGNDFTVVVRDKTVSITGSCNINVQGECNLTVVKNCNLEVQGDLNTRVKGDRRTRIDGNDYLDVAGEIDINIGSDSNPGNAGNYKLVVNGEYDEKIKGQFRSEVYKEVNMQWYGPDNNMLWISKKFNMWVGNKYICNAGEIDLRGCGDLPAEKDANDNKKYPLRNKYMGGLKKSPGISLSSGTGMMMATGFDKDDEGAVKYEPGSDYVTGDDIKKNVMEEVQEAKNIIGDSDNKIYIPNGNLEMSMGGILCTGTAKHAGLTTTIGNIQSGTGMNQTGGKLVAPLIESEHIKTKQIEAGLVSASDIGTAGDVIAGGKWKGGKIDAAEPVGVSLRAHKHLVKHTGCEGDNVTESLAPIIL